MYIGTRTVTNEEGAMSESEARTITVQKCYACETTGSLVECVGCGVKVCRQHRGGGGNNYRNSRDQEGYACHDCVDAGRVFERGLGPTAHRLGVAAERIGTTAEQIRDTLATLDVKLLPVVMAAVDDRLKTIQDTMVKPSVLTVMETADELVKSLLAETTKQLEVNANMLAGKADALVTSAVATTGRQLGEQTDKLAAAIDGRIDKLTEAVERLNPSKLMWQAGLVFGLVNVATVIAAVWIAKHM